MAYCFGDFLKQLLADIDGSYIFIQKLSLQDFKHITTSSGHNDQACPHTSQSCLSVLDTVVASWSTKTLLEKFNGQDLHIIPKTPIKPANFSEDTCKSLGIDVYQYREVHGKLGLF